MTSKGYLLALATFIAGLALGMAFVISEIERVQVQTRDICIGAIAELKRRLGE